MFSLKKKDFSDIIKEKNITEKTTQCPVYSILDTPLTTDKKECKLNTLKIHPNRNLGCNDLATQVTQKYNTKCHFGSGN